jgi:hypothetical protein
MTVRGLDVAPRSLFMLLLALGFVLVGCTGGSDEGDESRNSTSVAAEDQSDGSEVGDQSGAVGRLGFDAEVYEIPPPAGLFDGDESFPDAVSMIDAGVEAGVWTEADGVRAVISIVVGELPPEAVPAFDELPHSSHREILERAKLLLEDPTVDDAVRADLARLTDFFFSDTYADTQLASEESSTEFDSNGEQRVVLAGARGFVEQTGACSSGASQVAELQVFGATDTSVCYQVVLNAAGDAIWVPILPDAVDFSDDIFAVIEQARAGYVDLAGSELPKVQLFISTRPSPPDTGDPQGGAFDAHVISSFSTSCRVAVFATDTFFASGQEARFVIAHELFHCIQATWQGAISDKFTEEGGADYFAYRLLGECVATQVALGQALDTKTANGSLLDVDYEGWFYWAFLDEQGYLSPQAIAQLHQAVSEGTPVSEGVSAAVSDLPSVMNEFYVRLVGPGLACDFQGSEVTDTKTVKQKGPIELTASLWQGTRYKLDYKKKRLFEQENKGPGRIGMAKFDSRSDEGDWVVTTPEVRTRCAEDEPWIVVVTALDAASSSSNVVEVTEVSDGVCDACLIGQWDLDMGAVGAVFDKNIPGQSVDVSGSWIFEFGAAAPGASTAIFTEERNFQMAAGPLVVEQSGTGSGQYTADENTFVVSGYSSTVVASAAGFTSVPFELLGGDGGAAYECEGDSLAYSVGTDAWFASRIPSTPKGEPYFG